MTAPILRGLLSLAVVKGCLTSPFLAAVNTTVREYVNSAEKALCITLQVALCAMRDDAEASPKTRRTYHTQSVYYYLPSLECSATHCNSTMSKVFVSGDMKNVPLPTSSRLRSYNSG
ncbi:hypothetical protein BKA91DRAFT_131709 [Yarrowia lipolytica]|nr:hypothetical protein BKA91DRAFT_131709 [Yarrowia lipolytica]KAE8168858.1 hypothetical protein BKA90DRAFT_143561 [Yarrowia lipolytica]RMJ00309.1 hypothetical protein BD777DRAFT_123094 [Yarrowia lipolytica]